MHYTICKVKFFSATPPPLLQHILKNTVCAKKSAIFFRVLLKNLFMLAKILNYIGCKPNITSLYHNALIF